MLLCRKNLVMNNRNVYKVYYEDYDGEVIAAYFLSEVRALEFARQINIDRRDDMPDYEVTQIYIYE